MSSLWEVTEVEEVKITRKLLDSYKKLKRELPVLEYELNELWMTDKGMGNSVILNGKSGSKKPETVVGFDCEKYNRRKKTLAKKKKQVAVIEKWIDDIPDTRGTFYLLLAPSVDLALWDRCQYRQFQIFLHIFFRTDGIIQDNRHCNVSAHDHCGNQCAD